MFYPKRLVQIEVTNRCNAKCEICPRLQHIGKPMDMSFETAKSIIDNLSKHKKALSKLEFHFYRLGEPFLCKDLIKILKYTKKVINPKLFVFTNGSLLTKEKIKEILRIPLKRLVFSVDGYGKEYEKFRKLSWNNLEKNINLVLNMKEKLKSPTQVYIRQARIGKWKKAKRILGEKFPKLNEIATSFYYDTNVKYIPKLPCSYLSTHLDIGVNLDLLLCCQFTTYPIGHIEPEKHDIVEYWNKQLSTIRHETRVKKMPPPCRYCYNGRGKRLKKA